MPNLPVENVDRKEKQASGGSLFTQGLSTLSILIEQTLENGFRSLYFPSSLEKIYEKETEKQRRRQLVIRVFIGAFFYNIFLITDYSILSDVVKTALIVRLGLLTPITLLMCLVFLRGISPVLRETAISLLIVISGLTLILLMNMSNDPNKIAYYPGFLLIIIFGNVVILARFWYALSASLILFVFFYVLFYPNLSTLPVEIQIANLSILFSCMVMTMFSNYLLEKESRRGYLLSLQERIRHGDLAMQNINLKNLTYLDPLTRLANRREIDDCMYQLCEEPQPGSVAIIMFDMDNFKKYNDRYGHAAGDDCLKKIAGVMREFVQRKSDKVGRFGGEEFIIILSESDLEGAIKVAEQIREGVEECAIPNETSNIGKVITVSAGVAAGKVFTYSDVQHLLSQADSALYKAKTAGRNTIMFIEN